MPTNSKKTESTTSSFEEKQDEILSALAHNKVNLEDLREPYK